MRLLTVILMLLTVSLGAAELSSSAERAVENFNEDLAEAVEEFEEAKRDALADLTRVLERERERSERRGETEVVDLIDERLAAAKTELETAGQATDLLGQPVAIQSVNPRQAQTIARNLDRLTAEQWDEAPGLEVSASGAARTDTGITVAVGDSYIIIPHPEDKWNGSTNPKPGGGVMGIPCDWRGVDHINGVARPQSHMMMYWSVGSVAEWSDANITFVATQPIVTTETEGSLIIGPQDHGLHNNDGAIRVKVLRIVD